MKVAVFSTKPYSRRFLEAANESRDHELIFLEPKLSIRTAPLAGDAHAVCIFVNDRADAETLAALAAQGVGLVALRCAGFNNVDLTAAEALGIAVARVPNYSPHAVAEHAVGLMLALNRKIHRAYARVRDGNFALDDLMGFDLHGRRVGIIGTGRIGRCVARILHGFGCEILAFDVAPCDEVESIGRYVPLEKLLAASDIVTLHCPLTPQTHHLIDAAALKRVQPGMMLINTSRGALIDTAAVIEALKSGRVGYLGLDVYEEEEALFFEDLSAQVIQDDTFARLLTLPNVIVTGHQAFFTEQAMAAIAETTMASIDAFEHGEPLTGAVTAERVLR